MLTSMFCKIYITQIQSLTTVFGYFLTKIVLLTFSDSDFPSKCPVGGSLTRLDYHAALDDVWSRTTRGEHFHHRDSNVSTHTSGSSNEFAIEKVPPRRHRLTEVHSKFFGKRNCRTTLKSVLGQRF